MGNLMINSFEEADLKLLELGKHESFIAKKEAEMNAKIQKIKEKFDQETEHARAAKLAIEKDLQTFCLLNKKEFADKRSRKLMHGVIGFRTGTPKVLLLNRKYNWKTVLELLKKVFPGKYVRTKEEPNKDAILADVAQQKLDDQQLAAVGLKVDQDEKFFVEIDWENLNEEAA